MATPDQILALRRLVNELADAEPYTDEALNIRIDAAEGDLRVVARDIWTEKAAGYAELVDVQEGSSRRALGDLYEQAMKMSAGFTDDVTTTRKRSSRTRAIVRP